MKTQNKRKIINDPVYGFINIPSDIIFDLIEHPYFQRLRRIKQLGLTHFVYPGALHTRFIHALGSMHLMSKAIDVLRLKGHEINSEEAEAVTIAILLHDIGHGPFSHALEHSIVEGVSHEDISILFMKELNIIFDGKLSMAIEIFLNNYHKKFLHQLVSGQMDMDRMDYLRRDSFFTGVSEGVVGSDRIIKMLNINDGNLVIEAKGIYSIEKFLISRRLMYWQVYLHKTVLSAEQMLLSILRRAVYLARSGTKIFSTPSLDYFLYNKITKQEFFSYEKVNGKSILDLFANLDDNDFSTSIKYWSDSEDKVLSLLCSSLINRNLFRVKLNEIPFEKGFVEGTLASICKLYDINQSEARYLGIFDTISNFAYTLQETQINILYNNGEIRELSEASDILNIDILSKNVIKHFFIYPKEIEMI